MAGRKSRRGISFGTVFMLIITAAVLGSSAFVFLRLQNGQRPDLTRLSSRVIALQSGSEGNKTDSAGSRVPAADGSEKQVPVTETPRPAAAVPAAGQEATLVFGGTLAIEDGIRKSGYSSDSKKYDFTDMFSLLRQEMQADFSGVFLENLILDDAKVSTLVIPSAGAEAMKSLGLQAAALGFSRAWEKGESGLRSTMEILRDRGITPVGATDTRADRRYVLRDIRGIRAAMMQYTNMVSAKTRKSMTRSDLSWMIPEADPEIIRQDISAARNEGAQAVIVMLNWGKAGDQSPQKAQMALAQQIADMGADVIIGAGSRMPQRAEYLVNAEGKKTLCVYCLGTVISDSRKSVARMGGYLVRLTFRTDQEGKAALAGASYIPTYVWKFRQDGKDEYRVVTADRPAPDGMDSDQTRQMQKTLAAVQSVLQNSPLEAR